MHITPNGLSNPDIPEQVSWGGCFSWGTRKDTVGNCYTNAKGTKAYSNSLEYLTQFYPAIFNNFAARMDWAKEGNGNRNPIANINGDESIDILSYETKQGTTVELNASNSSDPDGDELKFNWWIQPDVGTFKGNIEISNENSSVVKISISANSKGENFHVLCELKDNGNHNLSSYRRIIFEPTN